MEGYHKKRVKGRVSKVNILVLQKNDVRKQDPMGKHGPNSKGPYKVIKSRRNGSYVLENIDNLCVCHFKKYKLAEEGT